MKTTIATLFLAFLLAACNATKQTKSTWVPKAGERVATNYWPPDKVGRVRIVTVTKVVREGVTYRIYTKEFPDGITLDWVAKWE